MHSPIDPNLISVRELTESDIPIMMNYWFRSPPGFIESMGVDPAKMPSESEMEAGMRARMQASRALPKPNSSGVAIVYDGKFIGQHSVNQLTEDGSAIFHAHIFSPEFRGRGIGMHSYPKACRFFMDRFNLKRILFKTPLQNTGSIRVKEKLGLRCVGEETIGFGIIKAGTAAKVFELTRAELNKLEIGGSLTAE